MNVESLKDYCRAMLEEGEDGEVIADAAVVLKLIEALEAVLDSATLSGQSNATYYVSYSAMDQVRAAHSAKGAT